MRSSSSRHIMTSFKLHSALVQVGSGKSATSGKHNKSPNITPPRITQRFTTCHHTSSCITAKRPASPRSMRYASWRVQMHRKYVAITIYDLRKLCGFGKSFQTFDEGLKKILSQFAESLVKTTVLHMHYIHLHYI